MATSVKAREHPLSTNRSLSRNCGLLLHYLCLHHGTFSLLVWRGKLPTPWRKGAEEARRAADAFPTLGSAAPSRPAPAGFASGGRCPSTHTEIPTSHNPTPDGKHEVVSRWEGGGDVIELPKKEIVEGRAQSKQRDSESKGLSGFEFRIGGRGGGVPTKVPRGVQNLPLALVAWAEILLQLEGFKRAPEIIQKRCARNIFRVGRFGRDPLVREEAGQKGVEERERIEFEWKISGRVWRTLLESSVGCRIYRGNEWPVQCQRRGRKAKNGRGGRENRRTWDEPVALDTVGQTGDALVAQAELEGRIEHNLKT
ncbi:hypothetical protein K438DRAFT_1935218 [Mycena galopus ATCC 62051]|nr:hypothetical protein K438DRAFT_1935218 [Mycena galopus ATCC 62051]